MWLIYCLQTLNFKLTSQEMEQLKGLNKDYRGCALEWWEKYLKHKDQGSWSEAYTAYIMGAENIICCNAMT